MQTPEAFYNAQKTAFQKALKQQKAKLNQSSFIRLVVFLAAAVGIYFTFGQWNYMLAIILVSMISFVYLVFRHANIKHKKDTLEALIHYNVTELEVLQGNTSMLDTGEEFVQPDHHFSYDIDLFGNASFFQYLNRTATLEGKNALAILLAANETTHIPNKQKAIAELSKKAEWRQEFYAIASLIKVETKSTVITKWLQNYTSFLPNVMQWLPKIFSLLSVTFIVLFYFQVISFLHLFCWFLIGLGITGIYLKKVNSLSFYTNKIKDTFQQYSQLLQQIEDEEFTSDLLQEKKQLIKNETEKTSATLHQFSKYIDALDNRNNILVAVFLNGLLLWDLQKSYNIEQWIFASKDKVAKWFDLVIFFDAYNSLGNFDFNHPEFQYPEIQTEGNAVLHAENFGHPLLDATQRIDNSFAINATDFYITTGANMAGKSTFLRTVSLGIIMANVGLPICASVAKYKPVKLITSMRTTDSLAEGASYFFSELQRLKMIVDEIENGDYFIILDEILKGTNSHDKAIGSKKIVEKLVAQKATGIIATHDLSLCELEKELPEVKNYFFDAEIINDELFFSYILKKGVCSNMNASFLLKKMEIVE